MAAILKIGNKTHFQQIIHAPLYLIDFKVLKYVYFDIKIVILPALGVKI